MTEIDENELWKENKAKDCNNLKFERIEIEFYPEDIEKMKNMTLEEENDYVAMLKSEGRYTIKNNTNNL